MKGGVLGLVPVETDRWGGLPLTLHAGHAVEPGDRLSAVAVLVALGRRSQMPAIRTICVLYVELIRGVPLISVLFMASFMLPLFMPQGTTIDVLLRVLVGMTLFTAAYLAEVVRGGLQAMPKGQQEAAQSLGLTYWQTQRKIILPQALRAGGAGHRQHLHRRVQGHLAGDHRQPLRPDRRDAAGAQFRRRLAQVLHRRPAVRGRHLLRRLLLDVRYSLLAREASVNTGKTGNTMSEPIIEFDKVNKWYGNNFHVLRDIDLSRRQGRAHRHLRALGLRQEHADPLHQPARRAPGRARWWSTASS
jgi:His/Glu/Gln/Arg/opine family amino acid ABC transporter permease subunit